uniref:Ribonuclease H-like domain-containing protein n=1 Tax=Tanacetum cinerariifolium TaxID=118510 RepID=A0A6L2JDK8_TANCI|nr:ribonuclease H-like domain-containing protein [Tanacetum cinerariifolium]
MVPKAILLKSGIVNTARQDNSKQDLQDKGVINSGCSRHITRNMSYLTNYEEINGAYVAFGGNLKGGKISSRGTIKTGKLDFKNVYFVRELKFNLFSVSQMCDKKNSVLFNDTECIVLSLNFKLTEESHVLLEVPRKNNMYSVDLKNIVPKGDLTCLFAKATSNESKLWHRRLGYLNFKTMNKLLKGNLVRGNQFNGNAGTKACDDAESKSSQDDGFQPSSDDGKKVDEDLRQESECKDQEKEDNMNITNNVNVAGTNRVNVVGVNTNCWELYLS